MRKMIMSAVAAAMATTSMTPAMAATVTFSSLPPAQQTSIQNTCNGFIPGNSNFSAAPVALDDTVQTGIVISTVVVQNIPGGTVVDPGTFSFDGESSIHRNGGSPNIFGTWTKLVTYSGGLNITEVTTANRHHVTFGCRLTKPNGELAPNGQQVANDGTHFVNYDTNTSTETKTVSAPDYKLPFTEDRVVCISPSTTSKKTQDNGWRQQNGYQGECSTTRYLAVGDGAGTHSNSVPGLTPLGPTTNSNLPLPLDALDSAPLPWDGEE